MHIKNLLAYNLGVDYPLLLLFFACSLSETSARKVYKH